MYLNFREVSLPVYSSTKACLSMDLQEKNN